MIRMRFAAALLAAITFSTAHGGLKPAGVIGSNMVLQAGRPVRIWGTADPDHAITATIADQTLRAVAGPDGKWSVELGPLKPGGPYTLVLAANPADDPGKTPPLHSVTLSNILAGEVWVCSGQSNMAMSVGAARDGAKEAAAANHPEIRLFTVPARAMESPADDCQGQWVVCTPETAKGFSAVGYYFGRHLHEALKTPVGLINSSWGGTPVEAWTARKALESQDAIAPLLKRWDAQVAGKPDDKLSPHRPGNLYNGMIHPIVPYTIRGAVWYQGESNVTRAYQYRTLFPAMIRNWRADWAEGDFPFLFVQIAPWEYSPQWKCDPACCPELWEAQLMTLRAVPNTGMAVTMDIGDVKDIHPANKQDVGKRLALWALANTYGRKDVVYSGPLYKSMAIEDGKVRIQFDHAAGLKTSDGKAPSHFSIAGEDRKFVPATAVIDGQSVVVSSEQTPKPVAVRYAWQDQAVPNLCNGASLPAAPFRTDDWPGVTQGKD